MTWTDYAKCIIGSAAGVVVFFTLLRGLMECLEFVRDTYGLSAFGWTLAGIGGVMLTSVISAACISGKSNK